MIQSQTSNLSGDKRNWVHRLWFTRLQDSSLSKWESLRISRSRWWLLIGEVSWSYPRYLWTVEWHTYGSLTHLSGYKKLWKNYSTAHGLFLKVLELFQNIGITKGDYCWFNEKILVGNLCSFVWQHYASPSSLTFWVYGTPIVFL
jgi:hypothetical protein